MISVDKDKLLTSHEVAKLLQVNSTSVNKWAKDGHFHAYRTPGGHRRIKLGDVLAFAELHQMPIAESSFAAVLGTETVTITEAGRAALAGDHQ